MIAAPARQTAAPVKSHRYPDMGAIEPGQHSADTRQKDDGQSKGNNSVQVVTAPAAETSATGLDLLLDGIEMTHKDYAKPPV